MGVSEKDLDKLPEDIREHVKNFLGQGGRVGIRVEARKALAAQPRVQARANRIDNGVGDKLDEINKRLEGIENALEKLTEE